MDFFTSEMMTSSENDLRRFCHELFQPNGSSDLNLFFSEMKAIQTKYVELIKSMDPFIKIYQNKLFRS